MKKWIWICLAACLFVTGCAAFRQAGSDKSLSDQTPLSAGETSPQERANKIAGALASLPYGAGVVAVPVAGWALGWFFSWRRGRKLRLQKGVFSEKPLTGEVGKTSGLEALVQHVADVRAGAFEVGPDGSGLKRMWKTKNRTELPDLVLDILQPLRSNNPRYKQGFDESVIYWLTFS